MPSLAPVVAITDDATTAPYYDSTTSSMPWVPYFTTEIPGPINSNATGAFK